MKYSRPKEATGLLCRFVRVNMEVCLYSGASTNRSEHERRPSSLKRACGSVGLKRPPAPAFAPPSVGVPT